ncbi:type VII secretion integral membrane protein EccD [Motilibacter deserti]|uniref:Type VII secretion integral membrane protein EccD n=1 Tax=Motilibacter deserti TaxID=2714956 RepID=A0ABX0GYZ6_9ACTN|nr:type VII secretion integral membrane protein EccD [Motilibacter deserti]NHC14819.1 type VII secretion integral membrane protein EccD [Motilibacter deserti]
MSTAAPEVASLLRVTVLFRGRRADLAVPGVVPVCDLLPELAAAVSALDPYSVHGGYRLVRADGSVLLPETGLTAQGVEDGAQLTVEPGVDVAPARVYDDVVEAVADTVQKAERPWDSAASRTTALAASALLLLLGSVALGLERHVGLPVTAVTGSLALLLVVAAAVLARTSDEPQAATVVAWSAVPYAAVAGLAGAPDEPVSRLPLALAGAGVLVAALAGIGALRSTRVALLPAAVVGTAGLAAGVALAATSWPTARVVAVVLVVAVLLGSAVPALALAAARVRAPAPRSDSEIVADPEPVDPADVTRQVRLGRSLQVALAVASGLLAVLSAPFVVRLGVSGLLLGVVACAVVLLRTRQYRALRDVSVGMACGIAGLVALAVAAVVVHPSWREALAACLVGVGVVLLAAAVTPHPPSIRLARAADVAEAVALVALLPLLVLATGLVAAVRS